MEHDKNFPKIFLKFKFYQKIAKDRVIKTFITTQLTLVYAAIFYQIWKEVPGPLVPGKKRKIKKLSENFLKQRNAKFRDIKILKNIKLPVKTMQQPIIQR